MKALLISKATAACALGFALVGCGAVDESQNARNVSADDVFAPAEASPAAGNVFPDPLSNTTVAAGRANFNPQSQVGTIVGGPDAASIATASAGGTRAGLQAIAVPVVQPQRPICIRPKSKATLARYAANCSTTTTTTTTRRVITSAPVTTPPTRTVTRVPAASPAPAQTFAPAAVSCSTTPSTKAGLAAYRANCMSATSSPVAVPAAQQAVAEPPVAPARETMVTVEPARQEAPTPQSTPAPAPEPATSTAAPEESTTAPSSSRPTSAIFDCNKVPSNGAELALARAYCE